MGLRLRMAYCVLFCVARHNAHEFVITRPAQPYVIGSAGVAVLLGMTFAWWQGPPQSPRTLQLVEVVMTIIGIVVTM